MRAIVVTTATSTKHASRSTQNFPTTSLGVACSSDELAEVQRTCVLVERPGVDPAGMLIPPAGEGLKRDQLAMALQTAVAALAPSRC